MKAFSICKLRLWKWVLTSWYLMFVRALARYTMNSRKPWQVFAVLHYQTTMQSQNPCRYYIPVIYTLQQAHVHGDTIQTKVWWCIFLILLPSRCGCSWVELFMKILACWTAQGDYISLHSRVGNLFLAKGHNNLFNWPMPLSCNKNKAMQWLISASNICIFLRYIQPWLCKPCWDNASGCPQEGVGAGHWKIWGNEPYFTNCSRAHSLLLFI